MPRLALMPLALLGLAFAPAPFPKTPRAAESNVVTLGVLQGRWRTSAWRLIRDGGRVETLDQSDPTTVRVEGDRWQFFLGTNGGPVQQLSVSAAKDGSRLTFREAANPAVVSGVGLLRRRGGAVEMMYCWEGEAKRPTSFDRPPTGVWIVTLNRE